MRIGSFWDKISFAVVVAPVVVIEGGGAEAKGLNVRIGMVLVAIKGLQLVSAL